MTNDLTADLDDLQRRLTFWIQQAQMQPVFIQKDGEKMAVVLSVKDFQRLNNPPKVISAGDMSDEDVQALIGEIPFAKPRS